MNWWLIAYITLVLWGQIEGLRNAMEEEGTALYLFACGVVWGLLGMAGVFSLLW